jgi:hypothetical protein
MKTIWNAVVYREGTFFHIVEYQIDSMPAQRMQFELTPSQAAFLSMSVGEALWNATGSYN